MITIDGKPFVATHYDGYPDSLGEDLKNAKTKSDILKVAEKHSIDFAELKNSEGDVFKFVGGQVIIKTTREKLEKEMKHKKELLDLRLFPCAFCLHSCGLTLASAV
jgi:uncharacterized Fe-S radical SAM superfamily protein PflX